MDRQDQIDAWKMKIAETRAAIDNMASGKAVLRDGAIPSEAQRQEQVARLKEELQAMKDQLSAWEHDEGEDRGS